MTDPNMFRGFCLFNDIEDGDLRTRNRAVVLANIATDNTRNRLISPNGAGIILGYFSNIPAEERGAVKEMFQDFMKGRGYALTV